MIRTMSAMTAAGVCFLFAGCGESVDFPDVAPVTGKVTLDGKPVEGAEVMLRPENVEGKGYPARATTDADGTFTVKTFFSAAHDPEGAVPGKYLVSVTKPQVAKAITSHAQALETEQNRPEGRPRQHAEVTGVQNALPKQYADATTSGLTIEVKEGSNELPLDLKSK